MRATGFAAELAALRPNMLRMAGTMTRSREEADDLVQDTLLRAWEARERFDGANLGAWVYTVMLNVRRSAAAVPAKRGRGAVHLSLQVEVAPGDEGAIAVDQVPGVPPDQEQAIACRDAVRAVRSRLSDAQARLLALAAGGATYDEIAMNMGITVGSVRSRLARIRTLLREVLL